VPHEREIEESGKLREELRRELQARAIAAGLYAANMPTEVRWRGLDAVSWVLYEKELGHTGYALHYACVARPSNILLACQENSASATCCRRCAANVPSVWR